MNPIRKLYYHLTAYFPRRLPATPEAYLSFKSILIEAYHTPDEPQIWTLVAGHICSTDPARLRKPWGHIANAAKRLAINNLAMGHKHAALQELNQKLAGAIERECERMKQEEAHDQKTAEIEPPASSQPIQTQDQKTSNESGPSQSDQEIGLPDCQEGIRETRH